MKNSDVRLVWRIDTPKLIGTYLFYGYTHKGLHDYFSQDPELTMIRVAISGNGRLMYFSKAEFHYPKSENSKMIGFWSRLDIETDSLDYILKDIVKNIEGEL